MLQLFEKMCSFCATVYYPPSTPRSSQWSLSLRFPHQSVNSAFSLSRPTCNALLASAQFGCQLSCTCIYMARLVITGQRQLAAIPGTREVPGPVSSRQNGQQQPREDVHIV